MRANRLSGHIRPNEGQIFGNGIGYPVAKGKARCSCGTESEEELPSANARKRWHRSHKAEVRQHLTPKGAARADR